MLPLPLPLLPLQFLLFYSCRQAPEPRCRAFLRLLINRMVDRQQPPIARSACAAYAASFLARAAFCPEHLVVDSLQRLADYCLRYSREEDRRGGLPPIPSATSIACKTAACCLLPLLLAVLLQCAM